MIILLTTGWSGWCGLAYLWGFQNYTLALFLYVLLLLAIGKTLGFGLDYYGSGWSGSSNFRINGCAPGFGMK